MHATLMNGTEIEGEIEVPRDSLQINTQHEGGVVVYRIVAIIKDPHEHGGVENAFAVYHRVQKPVPPI